jgi:amino acid adenylation domain-containing protein
MDERRETLSERRKRLSPEQQAILAGRIKVRPGPETPPGAIPRLSGAQSGPLSFSQEGLYILERFTPNTATYNIPLAFALAGSVDSNSLAHSIDVVVNRHDVLRARIEETPDGLRQTTEPPVSDLLRIVDLQDLPEDARPHEVALLSEGQVRKSFDLLAGGLVDACLYVMEPDKSLLVFSFHHIVFDGWSVSVFLDEVANAYNARIQGRPIELKPLPIQFVDFAVWERDRIRNGESEAHLTYWRDQLRDEPGGASFLTMRRSNQLAPRDGAVTTSLIEATDIKRLDEFCKRSGVTRYIALLSVWKTLLYRYSGCRDVLVGGVVAGRTCSQVEKLIGYFVNTVVLRTELTGDLRFAALVERVKHNCIAALDHQDLPFRHVVEQLVPSRSDGEVPFVQNMFLLQNTPAIQLKLAGVEVKRRYLHTGTAKFPVLLEVSEELDSLRLLLEYRLSVISTGTAEKMLEHFSRLLAQALQDPTQTLDQLEMLGHAERIRLLCDWNNTLLEYPRDSTIHEQFELQAAANPNATALTFLGNQLSYQQMNLQANRFARTLRAHGVTPGKLVATYLERSSAHIVLNLAILKAGGAYVPLDNAAPPMRCAHMLEETRAQLLVTSGSLKDRLPEFDGRQTTIEEIEVMASGLSSEPLGDYTTAPTSLAYVMYTSGSTGTPKGVCISHRNVLRLVCNANYADLGGGRVFLQLAPMSFDASTFETWGALLNGATLKVYQPELSSLGDLAEFIRREGIDILWLTAGLFNKMVEHHISAFEGVQQVLAGGDILSKEHVLRFLNEYPDCRLVNGYGPTESTTFACCHTVMPEDVGDSVPIGQPISNTSVYVLNEAGCLVPEGIPGELYIGGDGVALGYLNRPEETDEQFVPDSFRGSERMYRTGDLVRWISPGRLEFLGRRDGQVKVRGYRVELREVEDTLCKHPSIADAAVSVSGDEVGGKSLTAFVVAKIPNVIDLGAVRSYLREHLPQYMVPAEFFVIDELPLTTNGKVDRWALKSQAVLVGQTCDEFCSFTRTQETVAQIWRCLLCKQAVGLHDNFFDSGGNSLLALQLLDKIYELNGVRLPLRKVLEHPTIFYIASLVDESGEGPTDGIAHSESVLSPVAVPLRSVGQKVPFFCVCGAADVADAYGQLAAHMCPEQPFYGLQESLESLESANVYTVEELAEQFSKVMRSVQPKGPYRLGGWSFGGVVAFEMARRLKEMGQVVDCLVLVDCEARPAGGAWRCGAARYRMQAFVRSIHEGVRAIKKWGLATVYALPLFPGYARDALFILKSGRIDDDSIGRSDVSLPEYFRWIVEDIDNNLEFQRAKRGGKTGHRSRLTYMQDPYVRTVHRVLRKRGEVMRSFVPRPYDGAITLIRAKVAPLEWMYVDKQLGWDRVARENVVVYTIPGNHMSIIREPDVKGLAHVIQERLDGVSGSERGATVEGDECQAESGRV